MCCCISARLANFLVKNTTGYPSVVGSLSQRSAYRKIRCICENGQGQRDIGVCKESWRERDLLSALVERLNLSRRPLDSCSAFGVSLQCCIEKRLGVSTTAGMREPVEVYFNSRGTRINRNGIVIAVFGNIIYRTGSLLVYNCAH